MKKDIFQAIADPTRRAILSLIAIHALTPNALAEHFDLTRQGVSKHIQVLADAELVKKNHEGREIYYHVNAKKMKELADWLEPFQQLWETRFSQLDATLKNFKNKKS